MCKIALASDCLFDQLLNFEAGDAFVGGFLSQLVQELAVMLPTLQFKRMVAIIKINQSSIILLGPMAL